MSVNNESEEESVLKCVAGTKKRKKHGRMSEVRKKINLMSHVMGDDCKCRMKCFDLVPDVVKRSVLKGFNLMESSDYQDSYICGLISVLPINRRRPRNGQESNLKKATYKYRVRGVVEGQLKDFDICRSAFLAMHGIGKKRLERLVKSLQLTGHSPKNERGKHGTRPWRIAEDSLNLIRNHISSFPARNSHYGLKDSKKVYLDESLNISKMYDFFKKANPDIKASYEIYRTVFNNEFNIGFGYPRTDTCSFCDEHHVTLKALELERKNSSDPVRVQELATEISKVKTEIEVHKRKADTFYSRKSNAKKECKKCPDKEAVCVDYGRNQAVPNISTNDAYYRRQLSLYVFNAHILSSSESLFYLYTETHGKKGSDDVCSIIHDFVFNHLPLRVRELEFFSDSCGGQNKNYTVFRFMHYLVHHEKRFDKIKMTFPIRGHSYLEVDKNMGLVNRKTRCETPEDWKAVFEAARTKPTQFKVRLMNSLPDSCGTEENVFLSWTSFLQPLYKKKCFLIRPIKELVIEKNVREIQYRCTYNGGWEKINITAETKDDMGHAKDEFTLPALRYLSKC